MNDYARELGRVFSNGKKVGYAEGVNIQKRILNKKIDDKIFKIEKMINEFKVYRINAKTRKEKEYWVSEIASLIKQQRLLKDLKEGI